VDRGSDEVFQKSNLEDDEFHNFLSFTYGMLDVVRGVAQKCCSKVLQKKKKGNSTNSRISVLPG
jgi:hypothetical protein